MLYNDEEIAIMSAAVQPNMRKPGQSAASFKNIVEDFRLQGRFKGRVLDIGPGQCDLLDLARHHGAQTYGLDFDPAVAALGSLRGHQIRLAQLQSGLPADLGSFDGVFCRGSFNVFWFVKAPERLTTFLDSLTAVLGPDTWTWIAPWNSPGSAEPDAVERIEHRVSEWCASQGLERWAPDTAQKARWGIGYPTVPKVEVWLRNLAPPGRA